MDLKWFSKRSNLTKEFSSKETSQKIKDLLKQRVRLYRQHYQPGNIIFTSYNAKFKEFTYDKTPLALILKRGKTHTLVLNFHWIPVSMRINLIRHILLVNKKNIENNKPLEFSYEELKPMLKSLGYAPCIRSYINSRIGRIGVVIPPDRLTEVARLKTENFTQGKYSATQLYQMARKAGRKKNK